MKQIFSFKLELGPVRVDKRGANGHKNKIKQ
jgi:hypothetical protein